MPDPGTDSRYNDVSLLPAPETHRQLPRVEEPVMQLFSSMPPGCLWVTGLMLDILQKAGRHLHPGLEGLLCLNAAIYLLDL